MITTPASETLSWQISLFDVDDLEEFYREVASILHCNFDVDSYEIRLYDRKHKLFPEYRHGPAFGKEIGGAEVQLPLLIKGEDFGLIRMPASEVWNSADGEAFTIVVSLGLFFQKMIDEQSRQIDNGLAHIQALKSLGELLGELDQNLVLNRTIKFFIDLVEADVGSAMLYKHNKPLLEIRQGLPESVHNLLIAACRRGSVERRGYMENVILDDMSSNQFNLNTTMRIPLDLKAPYSGEIFIVSGDECDLNIRQQELISSCQVIGSMALQKSLDHEEQIRQHRLNEQLIVARDIQQQLLPGALPTMSSLEVVGHSMPALYVGGDYYDVMSKGDKDLIAIIADVSGKGVQAAMRMSGFRSMLHSLAWQDLGPGEILTRINEFLVRDSVSGHFITACCLMFREGCDTFDMAVAGHEPVLKVDRNGKAIFIEGEPGLPLGLKSSDSYAETEHKLGPGERLLMYTDGITDTCDEKGMRFGTERMMESFKGGEGMTTEESLRKLFSELEDFRGQAAWADDLTALTFNHIERGS
ncbi:MAG: serine/threonine-protein phosphatase [bacterium]|nr:serine/threonine-protein phosphatase [bacterium]